MADYNDYNDYNNERSHPHQQQQQEFDPFEKLRNSEFTNNSSPPDDRVNHPQQQQQQQQQQHQGLSSNNDNNQNQQQKPIHPFTRDFIDSLFTVVSKDLLFCKLFYFFFFGAFGSLFPLLAIYFKQLGMNASQSGLLIGFRPFIEFLSAPFWGGLADKWRRGKEMLLFALLCWIVFTLAIAFVQPPAHKCLTFNGTHNLLESPKNRRKRDADGASIFQPIIFHPSFENENLEHNNNMMSRHDDKLKLIHEGEFEFQFDQEHHAKSSSGPRTSPAFLNRPTSSSSLPSSSSSSSKSSAASSSSHSSNHPPPPNPPPIIIVLPEDISHLYHNNHHNHHYDHNNHHHHDHNNHHHHDHNNNHHRSRRSPYKIDASKIANANASDLKGLIFNQHSTIVYQEDAVKSTFFILLLLVILGEFFSAPAITFADSVTLSFLGDDIQNYGRQRMFGSLGWGLAMFFVGMALDHSTTFPDHPCGEQHTSEKNYTVCFAVFTVLMSCAFLTSLQFRFDHHHKDYKLSEIPGKVKKTVKNVISGYRKVDRERLVEDEDDVMGRVDKSGGAYQNLEDSGQSSNEKGGKNGSGLKIDPGPGSDMVTDALKAPGAKAGRGMGPTGAIPFGSAAANYSDQPFFGKWIAVARLLATYQYLSVLFIAWFMGFGIGVIFTFLFWHLQDLGGSPTLFGVASVINHISELLAYFMTGNFIAKYGHVKLLYAGLVGNIIRFLYISFLQNPWWVLPFEFVQGLTHAAVWAASCAYVTHAIPVELRSSAQGILQGLHHGLGRGCGAVFGGVMVYQYGSVVTFRIYGITCIVILAVYMGVNIFLQDRGKFSHGGKVPHDLFEDTSQLAPHGVPSGIARDLSSSRLAGNDQQHGYGATSYEGSTHLPAPGNKDRGMKDEENPMHHGYHQGDADRITMFEPPRLPTNIYKQQPSNNYQQDYGP